MKTQFNASIDEKIVKWIEDELKNPSTRFRSKSHLAETAIREFKEREEKNRGDNSAKKS